jgi:hypothetical protein
MIFKILNFSLKSGKFTFYCIEPWKMFLWRMSQNFTNYLVFPAKKASEGRIGISEGWGMQRSLGLLILLLVLSPEPLTLLKCFIQQSPMLCQFIV